MKTVEWEEYVSFVLKDLGRELSSTLYVHSLSIQFENDGGAGESYISIAYRICLEIRDGANTGSHCDLRCAARDWARIPKGEASLSLRMYAFRSQTWKIKNLETPLRESNLLRNLFDYSLFVRTC